MPERKSLLIRVDPAVHDALARWAAAELRSTNAHIELLLRSALFRAGRLPQEVGATPARAAAEGGVGAHQANTSLTRRLRHAPLYSSNVRGPLEPQGRITLGPARQTSGA